MNWTESTALNWIPVAAFFLGSIPFGVLIARLFKVKNLTSQGSRHIGATNVSRIAGFWPAGVITFVLDVIKGAMPVAAALYVWDSVSVAWLSGFLAVVGHCFSPWIRFKGGKGVATGFGVLSLLSPWAALVGAGSFAIVFTSLRTGSLASISGLMAALVVHLVFGPSGEFLIWGFLMVFLILIKHDENLESLLKRKEFQF